jgi:molybdopterin-containing oxidoreductase family membrane subunit
VLWFKKFRTTPVLLFISSIIVLIGMWLERYMIIVSSLAQDFVPSSWGLFHATRWDWATYWGTIGLFMFLFFLFVRLLPMISIFEVRTLLPQAKVAEEVRR